jgi:hypothetical protein
VSDLRTEAKRLCEELHDARVALIQAEHDRDVNATWRDCHKDIAETWEKAARESAKDIRILKGWAVVGWALFLATASAWALT